MSKNQNVLVLSDSEQLKYQEVQDLIKVAFNRTNWGAFSNSSKGVVSYIHGTLDDESSLRLYCSSFRCHFYPFREDCYGFEWSNNYGKKRPYFLTNNLDKIKGILSRLDYPVT